MAEVEARLFNEANTSQVAALSGAYAVTWMDGPNMVGSFSFRLDLADSDTALVEPGLTFRGLLGGTAVWAGVVEFVKPVPVEERREGLEGVEVSGPGILADLASADVAPAPLNGPGPGVVAAIDPPIDDRWMEWYGVDFDDSADWVTADEYDLQGEASTIWPGMPAGMRPGIAYWIGPGSPGSSEYQLARQWIPVDPGPFCLDFAGYDVGVYVNGRRHQRNAAYFEKERVEFEVLSSGYVLLAFEARWVSGADPGFCWLATEGPDGPVIASSGSACYLYDTQSATPNMTANQVLFALKADHDTLDDWTFNFTGTADSASASVGATSGVSVRVGDDSLLTALEQFGDVYLDFDAGASGKVLSDWVKGTHANSSSLPLVAGASTAGEADPDAVNIRELEWETRRAPFTALRVRWAGGWFHWPDPLPTDPRFQPLGLQQISRLDVAQTFAEAYRAAVGVDVLSPAFAFLPVDASQWPYTAFDKWSTLELPSAADLDVPVGLAVAAIDVDSDDDGQAVFTVEVGTLAEVYEERVQRWIARATRGGAGGQMHAAQAVERERPPRVPGTTMTNVPLLTSVAVLESGYEQSFEFPMTGRVDALRLLGQGATGASDVEVFIDGVSVATLSGSSGSDAYTLLDVDEAVGVPVTVRSVGRVVAGTVVHPKLDLSASMSER